MVPRVATSVLTKAGFLLPQTLWCWPELQSLKQHQVVKKPDLVLVFLFQTRYISGGISSDLWGGE